MTPICCINPNWSVSTQCSTNLPLMTVTKSEALIDTFLPVGGIPCNSPLWVAVILMRVATLSPSAIMSSKSWWMSGNAWGWYRLLVCVHSNPAGALLGNVRSNWCLILTAPCSLCRVVRKLQRIDELCLYFFVLVVLLLVMPFLANGMIVTDLNLIWQALPAFWHSHCNLRCSFSSPFFFLFSNIFNSHLIGWHMQQLSRNFGCKKVLRFMYYLWTQRGKI